jgi:hypothetical protein
VNVKLNPETCINKASSNSRLTAVGRLFFLSSFDETTTELHLHAKKLTETVLHMIFFFFSPLMR